MAVNPELLKNILFAFERSNSPETLLVAVAKEAKHAMQSKGEMYSHLQWLSDAGYIANHKGTKQTYTYVSFADEYELCHYRWRLTPSGYAFLKELLSIPAWDEFKESLKGESFEFLKQMLLKAVEKKLRQVMPE
ncbi:DUF2513 domain-containing protein [Vibrio cholerae]|uniref:DUF2513 domain-containing protein n=1 Tax=Vibrio cholerae TaxID=666 RepID=A0A7Z7YEY0_VIBCL|nr:DUF2513 domain-containing protein [Vibrio cholerae]KQA30225.1 hypothetical protein F546_00815 [Vibrio paracholerae 877-163]EGQ9629108.1 DUF2513 domain-containing protein [Vibrio cholerae]EGQ9636450.1 DUF2513 domain-containing protein [Vibrio cholerae]EGQ9844788.1 DUF2513 domain-containing protein [Vibrio cholerae]EGR1040227.1 DUF2513 domain-containing protein [Vibrio cholerae]